MTPINIEGTVVDIRPMVSGQRADGTPWQVQTYALQVDAGAGFTNVVAFEIFDEARIRQWNIRMGEHITVSVNPSSTPGRDGGYFTHLRAYKVTRGYEGLNDLIHNLQGQGANTVGNSLALLAQLLAANQATTGPMQANPTPNPANTPKGAQQAPMGTQTPPIGPQVAPMGTQTPPMGSMQAPQPQQMATQPTLQGNRPTATQPVMFDPRPAGRPDDDLPF